MRSVFHKPEFYGSATVGERGQIVLPAELRKKVGIKPGDKLLVLGKEGPEGTWSAILVESSVLKKMFSSMTEDIGRIFGGHEGGE